jgi:hypothetical protein
MASERKTRRQTKMPSDPTEPSSAMFDDMRTVFAKHNWSGTMIWKPAAAQGDSGTQCPPGQSPHEVSYQLPDGTWVTKIVCM